MIRRRGKDSVVPKNVFEPAKCDFAIQIIRAGSLREKVTTQDAYYTYLELTEANSVCALSANGALWHRLSHHIALLHIETFEQRGPLLLIVLYR